MIDEPKKQEIQQAFQYLGSNNDRMRENAVKKLGELGFAHPQILDRLRKIKEEDPSPDVREAASRSLTVLLSTFTQPQPQSIGVSHPIGEAHKVTPSPQLPSLGARNQVDEFQRVLTPSPPSNENQLRLIELLEKQNDLLEDIKSILLESFIEPGPSGLCLFFQPKRWVSKHSPDRKIPAFAKSLVESRDFP